MMSRKFKDNQVSKGNDSPRVCVDELANDLWKDRNVTGFFGCYVTKDGGYECDLSHYDNVPQFLGMLDELRFDILKGL